MRSDSVNVDRSEDLPLYAGGEDSAERPVVRPKDHWYGILVSICVFLCQCGIYGALNSYSVFSHQITEDETIGKPTSTEVSFGNSLSNGFGPIVSIFAGALTDRFGPRIVLACAALLVSIAYFAASFANSVTILVLAYSVPACIGSACLSTPGSAAVSSWLEKRLNIGMGIAYSGNGAGSSIIVPIAGLFAGSLSWRASFKYMAAFPLISLVAALFVSFRVKPEPRKPLSADERAFLKRLLTSRAYWTLCTAAILFSFTFFSVLYIIVPFAGSYGEAGSFYADYPRIKIEKAATLFTWFGVFKWIGSVSLGMIAQKIEARVVYALSSGLAALLICLWPLCSTYAELAVVASAVGFTFAGMFATLPSMSAKCFSGKYAGLGIGMTMAGFTVGGFAGPPVILALKTLQGDVYTLSFTVMALTSALSGLICFFAGDGHLGHQDYAAAPLLSDPLLGDAESTTTPVEIASKV